MFYPSSLSAIEKIGRDVFSLKIEKPKETYRFLAGQYCYISCDDKQEDKRAYSIASSPDSPFLEFHIRDTGSDFTQTLCAENDLDKKLYVSDAQGSLVLNEGRDDVVLIAGGTGYAPMRSMLYKLQKGDTKVKIELYIGGRDIDSLYMRDELSDLMNHMPSLACYFTADDLEEVVFDDVQQGSLSRLLDNKLASWANKEVYIAGPAAMVLDIQKLAVDNGASEDRLYVDEENLAYYKTQLVS